MIRDSTAKHLLGLGIAGNSAGHLQQTGEITAFENLKDFNRPQALFPFYIPQAEEDYLAIMPYSADYLVLPTAPQARVQMEAELVLRLATSYDLQGALTELRVVAVGIANDATYRNATVSKLAQKKNWGAASKGLAAHEIQINQFTSGCRLDHFRLCGFHQRNDQWSPCGEDVALTEYCFFYEELLHWLLAQILIQEGDGLFHNIQDLLGHAGYPDELLIAIGATGYGTHAQEHQLLPGDRLAVALYDSRVYTFKDVSTLIRQEKDLELLCNDNIIFLQQEVV